VVAEHNAERVARGVGENPEARLTFTGETGRAQSEQFLFGLAGVAHADVQMHLLRVGRVGPARRNPVSNALEGQLPQPRPEPMTTQPSVSSLIRIPSTWQ
jgi:hypothetical protein